MGRAIPPRVKLALGGAILVQWVTPVVSFFVPELTLVGLAALPFILVFGLWLAYRRHFAAFALLIVTSPVTIVAFLATIDYVRGNAYVLRAGKPILAPVTDDATGLPVASTGCVVDATDWLRNGVHNCTLRVLTGVFGVPRRPTQDFTRAQ